MDRIETMLVLAADTTTETGSVALLEKGVLRAEINFASGLTHSEKLLPSIDFILKKTDRRIKDVDGFALAVGPGSFTGIRVGMSTFKSFSYASEKPVAPVSTLEALAWKLRHPQVRLICAVQDAKKAEVYAALYESKGNRLVHVIPQGAYRPDRFFSMLPPRRVVYFIGTGAVLFREKIQEYMGDKARFPHRSLFIAHEVGILGYDLLKKNKGRTFLEIEPLYMRRSQAEEER